jgi:hypothetical protein
MLHNGLRQDDHCQGGREAVAMVWSPTKDVRREVAKENLGMYPTRKKEKRTTTKDLVQ